MCLNQRLTIVKTVADPSEQPAILVPFTLRSGWVRIIGASPTSDWEISKSLWSRNMKVLTVSFAAAALAATVLYSQQPQGGRPGPPPRPPRDAFFQLFDTDNNGEISMKEIDAAAAILKKLDRDGNHVLTPNELPRPPRPGNDRRPPRAGDRPPRQNDRDQGAQRLRNAPRGTVVFIGGYETDPRDRGRPVSLIAAALGVKPGVFRNAFSRVNPARGGEPTREQVQANKKVLLDALGKYGITNDRLDTVSNYYRYQRGRGEVWRRSPASAKAVIKDGKVAGFTITNAGAGYTTPPTVRVAGYGDVQVKVAISFSKEFKTNGRVTALSVVE